MPDGFEAIPKSVIVAQHLFGVRIGFLSPVGKGPVEFVVGGDDVFNFGRKLGFLQPNRLDHNRLVGNQLPDPLQFGQGAIGGDGLFQHGFGLQLGLRGEIRQIIVRFLRVEGHDDLPEGVYVEKSGFYRHVFSICRSHRFFKKNLRRVSGLENERIIHK